jgi:Cu2+-exporting ATPase
VAIEGLEDAFCCRGCETAWSIIQGAGLERYYAERTELPPRPEPLRERWDSVEPERMPDGTCQLRLAVDGLRCASCVWVTESVLERTEGIESATVSYATGRATVRWDPDRIGLDTVAGRISSLGYRPRIVGTEARRDDALLTRLGVAAFAAANVMMFSAAIYAGWLGTMEAAYLELFRWASLVLATPVALYSASPFFEGAWTGLRHRVLHMDVPIALAVAVLYAQGLVGTLVGFDTYLDSLTMLVTLLLAGRVLESGGRRRAAEAAVTLAATVPATARRIVGDTLEVVASESLLPGDRIAVGAGEDLPADGVVVAGRGSLQRALLTGESAPVVVEEGDEVWAGTVLLDGSVTVDVSVAVEGTVIQQMAEQLRQAADRGTRPSSSDRLAPWFTGATLAVAAVTFSIWLPLAGGAKALATTVAVLIVACPCALALAKPLTAAAGLGAAARRGLLFRSADALLETARVDVVALDKTGTVTEGAVEIASASDHDVRVAAGLERYSRHPIAIAVIREAIARGLALPAATDVREEAGAGISGRVDGTPWRLRSGGADVVVLEGPNGYRGLIRIGDRVRDDSRRAVGALRALGAYVVLLSGDDAEPTGRIAEAIGASEWWADQRPAEKARRIEAWRQEGRMVLLAGDGMNDGPALAAADIGVAMGTGAASSIMTADAVLGVGSIQPLVAGVRVSRVCRDAVRANQIRSVVYNVLAVSAAAAGWVNPLVAAVLMPLSSAMVVAGAGRVERRVRALERA